MGIKTKYVQERHAYSTNEIENLFSELDQYQVTLIINKLKRAGILKIKVEYDKEQIWSDLADDNLLSENDATENSKYYVFDFVGVVCVSGYVFKCYPKYLKFNTEPLKELKQVISVIEKASLKELGIKEYEHVSETDHTNLLSLMVYLLNDYYENGLYRNELDVLELNGNGEIDWDRTINNTYPVISSNQPYYVELFTKRRVKDDSDYFYRLHSCVLTKICKELEEADLAELLDILPLELSEESIDDFGEPDYISERIRKELRIQFNTHKQSILKALNDYIVSKSSLHDNGIFSLYGTNCFHTVWEKVCAHVFDNVLDKSLQEVCNKLGVVIDETYKNDRFKQLKDLVPKPEWKWPGTKNSITIDDTLKLDLVAAFNSGKHSNFIIFDAKYYIPKLSAGKKLFNVPGIADVTKQYFYQLAFMPFILAHRVDKVRNCFLMPMQYFNKKQGDFDEHGEVKIDMFHHSMLDGVKLQSIMVRFIHPEKLYDLYLADRKIPIEQIDL